MPSSPDLYRGRFLSVTQVSCARIQCRALKRFACPLWALAGLGVLVVWSWHLIGRAFYCPIGPDGEIHTTLLNPMYTYHDLNDSYFLYVIRCLLWQLVKGIRYVDLTPIIHLVVFVSEGLTLVVYPSDLTLVVCLFGFSLWKIWPWWSSFWEVWPRWSSLPAFSFWPDLIGLPLWVMPF